MRLFGICLCLMFPGLRSVEAYDPEKACRVFNFTAVERPVGKVIQCPVPSATTASMTLPAYCCGPLENKSCCDWSTYVVNTVGGGNTSLGLFVMVCITALASVVCMVFICGIFQMICVAGWKRESEGHRRGSRPSQCPAPIKLNIAAAASDQSAV